MPNLQLDIFMAGRRSPGLKTPSRSLTQHTRCVKREGPSQMGSSINLCTPWNSPPHICKAYMLPMFTDLELDDIPTWSDSSDSEDAIIKPNLTPIQKLELDAVLGKYLGQITNSSGWTTCESINIDTGDTIPRAYTSTLCLYVSANTHKMEFSLLLHAELIRPSQLTWASLLVLVPKK